MNLALESRWQNGLTAPLAEIIMPPSSGDIHSMQARGAIVPGPRGRPPLEDLRALQQGPHAFLLRATSEYGDFIRYPVGPIAVYVVNHPDYVKHVLQDNSRNYTKDTFQYKLLSSVTGQGLLTSDGEFWLRQRRLAQPAFHRQRIAGFGPVMSDAIQCMLSQWGDTAGRGAPVDIAAEMMHLALQIVCRTLFDLDVGDQASSLARATLVVLDHIVQRARTFGVLPEFLPTPANRRFRAALRTLDQAVATTIQQHHRGEQAADDLLATLMAAQDEETGERMTDRQLRDEIITMIIAGHETVASALAWTWYLLSQNPSAERALHEELATELGGRVPTVDDLPNLQYTRQVFEEALRLYPPAWIITRKAAGHDDVGGFHVPPGALVVASPYATHRHPNFWPSPDAFEPQRFAPECAAQRPRFAYYPFGGGPHLCIGNVFAMMEAQLAIASIAQVYRLHLAPGHPVEVEPSVTLRPRFGLRMTIEPSRAYDLPRTK